MVCFFLSLYREGEGAKVTVTRYSDVILGFTRNSSTHIILLPSPLACEVFYRQIALFLPVVNG